MVALLFALATPAFAATSLSVSLTATTSNPGDALLVGAAALFFGLDTSLSMQYSTSIGTATSAVSLFYVSAESQQQPEVIISERNKGRGWGAVAKGKMPPGLANKWKGGADPFSYNDKDFETGTNLHFLATYYAVPEDSLILWVKRGVAVPDLAVCLNLASRVHVAPSVIVELRLKGIGWTQLAGQYKVSQDLLKQPVPPKAKYSKTVPAKKPSSNSGNNGKGNSSSGKGKGK
jgi:hypothetical protein